MGRLKNLKLRNRFIFGDKIIVFMTFTELQFKETTNLREYIHSKEYKNYVS